jgi:hypothetical protein
VCANEDSAEFLEVAVLFVLNLSDTPGVLATLDCPLIRCGDIPLGADDGEWHGGDKAASVLQTGFVVLLERRCVDLDALSFDDIANLKPRVS